MRTTVALHAGLSAVSYAQLGTAYQVMSCAKEEDVLLRWRDLVLETDPDIIIGCGYPDHAHCATESPRHVGASGDCRSVTACCHGMLSQ